MWKIKEYCLLSILSSDPDFLISTQNYHLQPLFSLYSVFCFFLVHNLVYSPSYFQWKTLLDPQKYQTPFWHTKLASSISSQPFFFNWRHFILARGELATSIKQRTEIKFNFKQTKKKKKNGYDRMLTKLRALKLANKLSIKCVMDEIDKRLCLLSLLEMVQTTTHLKSHIFLWKLGGKQNRATYIEGFTNRHRLVFFNQTHCFPLLV